MSDTSPAPTTKGISATCSILCPLAKTNPVTPVADTAEKSEEVLVKVETEDMLKD